MKGTKNSLVLNAAFATSFTAILSSLLYFTGNATAASACLILLILISISLPFAIKASDKKIVQEISSLTNLTANDIAVHVEFMKGKEREVIEYIDSIRNNEKAKSFTYLQKEVGVGSNLLALTEQLHQYRTDENKRGWMQGGLARFSELQKEGKNVEEFSATIISFLVKYLDANQGGIFIEQRDLYTNERYLELKGCYAYDKRKFLNKRISEGDGLLGECMLSHSMIFITDVPSNYVHITSGLGQALPRNIVIVPLIYNGEFFGAVEMATFSVLEDHQRKFLEKVCEYIAAEVATRKTVQDTEKLLMDSQELTQKLKEHEEEMQQHMEELTATQEQMRRKQSELDSVFSAINNTVASVEFDLQGNILSANSIFLGISGYSMDRLKQFNYTRLLPIVDRDKPQHEMMWKNLRDGKFFSGEFKMLSDIGDEMWMSGTFNPMMDSRNVPYKIIMIAQFTTQEKSKQFEMTGTIAAAKNSVPYLEMDTNFQCKSANDRFLTMFGLKRVEIKDKAFCSLLAKSSGNAFKKNLMALKDEKYFEDTLEFAMGDEAVTFVTGFTPIRDHNNKTTRIVVILSDKIQSVKIAAVA